MKKFITILSFSILLLLALSINIFAMEYPADLPPLPEKGYYFNGPQKFLVYKNSSDETILLLIGQNTETTPFDIILTDTNTITITNNDTHNDNWYSIFVREFKLVDGNWSSYSDFKQIYPKQNTTKNFSSFTYTEVDVLNSDGTVFFPLTPQVKQTILAPIVEETETQKTLAEVVGILPLIIVVVVSFLGLRKALKMLSALLHRS